MRKLVMVLAALVVAGILQVASASPASPRPQSLHPPVPEQRCLVRASEFRQISAAIWDHDLWERGRPAEAGRAAYRHALHCAPSASHRHAMKRTWHRHQRSYAAYREYRMLNPYWGCTTFGGCRYYALPAYIVDCESGGDYTPNVGALTFGGMYGLLIPTWQQWGGQTYAANEGSPREQDRIAGEVWRDVGPGGWECA